MSNKRSLNPKVDTFLSKGCGRCSYYNTQYCKVIVWNEPLRELRRIVLMHELKEELKWSQPCYTYQGNNVLSVSAFKDYAFVSFFKGSLLGDPYKKLIAPGKNSQAARQYRFNFLAEIKKEEAYLNKLIEGAIQLEKEGKKVQFNQKGEPLPEELLELFSTDDKFQTAFNSLTPGRQRGYIIYFSQPKQAVTRSARIEKYYQKIMSGKGLHDDYQKEKKSL